MYLGVPVYQSFMPSAKNLKTDNIKKLILYNLNLKAQSDVPEDNEVQNRSIFTMPWYWPSQAGLKEALYFLNKLCHNLNSTYPHKTRASNLVKQRGKPTENFMWRLIAA